MHTLAETAPAFIEWRTKLCGPRWPVDRQATSHILHPIWEWDGAQIVGLWGTRPTPVKRAHLEASPYVSVNYWTPAHDTCVAECRASWAFDDETRTRVWNLFLNGPAPVGYDPAIVPGWDSPTSESFAALRLEPWRLRVFPGTVLLGQGGNVLTWQG
ncbi:MAG: hypothetical protein R2911_31190 [Caldilineaceae bacterium]